MPLARNPCCRSGCNTQESSDVGFLIRKCLHFIDIAGSARASSCSIRKTTSDCGRASAILVGTPYVDEVISFLFHRRCVRHKLPRILNSQLLMLQSLTPESETNHTSRRTTTYWARFERSLHYSEPNGVNAIVSWARPMRVSVLCGKHSDWSPPSPP